MLYVYKQETDSDQHLSVAPSNYAAMFNLIKRKLVIWDVTLVLQTVKLTAAFKLLRPLFTLQNIKMTKELSPKHGQKLQRNQIAGLLLG